MRRASSSPSRYLIQLDRPGEELDMSVVQKLLEGTDVELDPGYGPILISKSLGRYLVRGTATLAARAKAESLPGVRLFGDAAVKPITR